ncbi:polar amino acid transport system permease protein [Agrobacterium tumefaciens]|uniref:Amino acid ABC transporter permease n=1 Tax=Agrobacterium tumefaciens TaxID=358 RepID=A0AAP9E807_AGRTU|nr:amino acid ABC transporter permease [Agrobacterium tumefaciens]MBP2511262.1 polar amino acid transport system permease protein [Agrobacterium tumefaciens]MBP2520631.1 polar amino acid transport system permease protein [Agrobacterium tumefaciens]MBP2579299.1 polar amino acid transport system permease protein [Agrobacterium tumefaciens]MBP2597586.1 polar amino acid transport system permease protein [Agrobacterium tumefaciens]MCW8060246.1 amino acid ABC transporter permease [Agrobacterium tume
MNYTFDFTPVFAAWPMLADGIIGTLKMSSLSMVFGLSLGIVFMSMRMSKQSVLRTIAIGYIELIRNTPILVQVFFVFFGMPALGIRLSGEQAAILAMTLNCAAYAAEIVRGGVQSIRPGQIEAGRALGLHTVDIYRFVVFRPAIRAVYPALCSQFILMMLNSSLMSSVSAEELTYFAQTLDSHTFRSFEIYLTLGAIYLALSQFFSIALGAIGRVYFSYPVK